MLCDLKTWSRQANVPLVIEFHIWKNVLCNSQSGLLLVSFQMLHVQKSHNLCMFSRENYIIGWKKAHASMILRCYII